MVAYVEYLAAKTSKQTKTASTNNLQKVAQLMRTRKPGTPLSAIIKQAYPTKTAAYRNQVCTSLTKGFIQKMAKARSLGSSKHPSAGMSSGTAPQESTVRVTSPTSTNELID